MCYGSDRITPAKTYRTRSKGAGGVPIACRGADVLGLAVGRVRFGMAVAGMGVGKPVGAMAVAGCGRCMVCMRGHRMAATVVAQGNLVGMDGITAVLA